MKASRILVLLLICLCPLWGKAQDTAKFQPELSFGVNGGLTLSSISFNPSVPQGMLQQYVGGFTIRYISERNFGLQAELNYSMRGWKETNDPITNPNDYSRSISYLELPVMTHLFFGLGGKRTRGFFNFGPQVGCYLSEKTLDSVIDPEFEGKDPAYYSQDVQRYFDWGLTGGAGIELRTGAGSFILDGRYYFGLSDIFSNSKSDQFQSSSNQVISIKLTYLFRK